MLYARAASCDTGLRYGTVGWPCLDGQDAAVNQCTRVVTRSCRMPMLPGGLRQHAARTSHFTEPGTIHLALLDGRDPMSETRPLKQCPDGDCHRGGGGGWKRGGVLMLVVEWRVVEKGKTTVMVLVIVMVMSRVLILIVGVVVFLQVLPCCQA